MRSAVGWGGVRWLSRARAATSATRQTPDPPVRARLQALAYSPLAPTNRLQIGGKLTRGLGAGGNPNVGYVSAAQWLLATGACVTDSPWAVPTPRPALPCPACQRTLQRPRQHRTLHTLHKIQSAH
jgi:hypothetical protein